MLQTEGRVPARLPILEICSVQGRVVAGLLFQRQPGGPTEHTSSRPWRWGNGGIPPWEGSSTFAASELERMRMRSQPTAVPDCWCPDYCTALSDPWARRAEILDPVMLEAEQEVLQVGLPADCMWE